VLRIGAKSIFRSDDQPVADTLRKFTDQFFTAAISIKISCVDEIATFIKKCVKNLPAFIDRRTPSEIFSKGHGAET
jgi:hypothetical protein